jgi:hypothetical protein
VQSTFEYYDADGNGCMDGPEFAKMAAELVSACARVSGLRVPLSPARATAKPAARGGGGGAPAHTRAVGQQHTMH